MSDIRNPAEPDSLPDDVAQRVIARAIALDSDGAARMPIARLREIALEAGISPASLQRALTEALAGYPATRRATAKAPGFLRRIGQRLVGSAGAVAFEPLDFWSLRGALEATATNLIALALFWVPSLLLLSFLHALGFFTSGALDTGSVLVCVLGGIAIAWRLRARLALAFLGVCAAGITVNLIVDVAKLSRRTGFFGSNAFTWSVAALIGLGVGVLLGRWTSRRSRRAFAATAAAGDGADQGATDDGSLNGGRPFLRLRLQESLSLPGSGTYY